MITIYFILISKFYRERLVFLGTTPAVLWNTVACLWTGPLPSWFQSHTTSHCKFHDWVLILFAFTIASVDENNSDNCIHNFVHYIAYTIVYALPYANWACLPYSMHYLVCTTLYKLPCTHYLVYILPCIHYLVYIILYTLPLYTTMHTLPCIHYAYTLTCVHYLVYIVFAMSVPAVYFVLWVTLYL